MLQFKKNIFFFVGLNAKPSLLDYVIGLYLVMKQAFDSH